MLAVEGEGKEGLRDDGHGVRLRSRSRTPPLPPYHGSHEPCLIQLDDEAAAV